MALKQYLRGVMKRSNWILSIAALLFILALTAIISIFIGTVRISPFAQWQDYYGTIIYDIRLPRIFLCIIVGAGLAVAGAIFQGLLRNPLADPFIIGTSSGAGLGAVIAIFLGVSLSNLGIPLFAFLFALLSIILVYNIAGTQGKTSIQTLLLAGIIVSSFLSALMMLIMSLNRKEISNILFWIMGNLTENNTGLIKVCGIFVLLSIFIVMLFARDLNIMSLGEETAGQLGIETEKTKKFLFVLASLIVGAVVSVSGMIGFVGLIVPHITRMIVGPDHRILIPSSALAGAILLIIADTIARTIASPVEIPVGIVTALFGAPFFIYLLRKSKRVPGIK